MKVNTVKSRDVCFGTALNSRQIVDYQNVSRQANELLHTQGKKVLIVHDASLPQTFDTGVGNLADKKALEFIDLMKKYLSINFVELLPQGEYNPYNGFSPYWNSSLSLGQHLIDPVLLTTPEYGNILTLSEVKVLADKNKVKSAINYENIVGRKNNYEPLLRKAFERFKESPDVGGLKSELAAFKAKNLDWLVPKTIFAKLAGENGYDWRKWSDADKNLYLSNTPESLARIKQLSEKYADDIEFYSFRQFLSQNHLGVAKKNLNEKGIELIGDCLANFSQDEFWAHQNAFIPDTEIGFGIKAIDYTRIYNPDGSLAEAGELLKRKFSRFFELYDGVRFDMAWSYIQPTTLVKREKVYINDNYNELDGSILRLIEKTAKEEKGVGFDLSKLFYETTNSELDDFNPFDGADKVNPLLRRKMQIFTTEHKNARWGSLDSYRTRFRLSDDEFLFGVSNHDTTSLKSLANGDRSCIKEQIEQLAQFFRVSKEFLSNPVDFVKTKHAEILLAKNQMYFFNDVLGSGTTFNTRGSVDDFFIRISKEFERVFHTAIQEGYALNPMDGYEKDFIFKGLDKEHPELFKKIQELNRILSEPGVKTQKEADELLNPIVKKNKHLKPVLVGLSLIGAAVFAFISIKKHKENVKKHKDDATKAKETVEFLQVNQRLQLAKDTQGVFSILNG